MLRPIRIALLAVALAASACAPRAGAADGSSSRAEPRNPNVIGGDQIQEAVSSGLGNAYDLVARLHPNWMRSVSSQTVQVWMDNQRMGSPTALRNISLTAISSIRYLSPSEAQGQLGLNNQGGAIVVTGVR